MKKTTTKKPNARESAESAALRCHPRCRTSTSTSPFAPCRCQCGGYAHGSETLRGMSDVARARAAREMRAGLHRGAAMVTQRLILGAMRDFERSLRERSKRRA